VVRAGAARLASPVRPVCVPPGTDPDGTSNHEQSRTGWCGYESIARSRARARRGGVKALAADNFHGPGHNNLDVH